MMIPSRAIPRWRTSSLSASEPTGRRNTPSLKLVQSRPFGLFQILAGGFSKHSLLPWPRLLTVLNRSEWVVPQPLYVTVGLPHARRASAQRRHVDAMPRRRRDDASEYGGHTATSLRAGAPRPGRRRDGGQLHNPAADVHCRRAGDRFRRSHPRIYGVRYGLGVSPIPRPGGRRLHDRASATGRARLDHGRAGDLGPIGGPRPRTQIRRTAGADLRRPQLGAVPVRERRRFRRPSGISGWQWMRRATGHSSRLPRLPRSSIVGGVGGQAGDRGSFNGHYQDAVLVAGAGRGPMGQPGRRVPGQHRATGAGRERVPGGEIHVHPQGRRRALVRGLHRVRAGPVPTGRRR